MGLRIASFVILALGCLSIASTSYIRQAPEYGMEQTLHQSIRPDLVKSLHESKRMSKIRQIIDADSIEKLEEDIHEFVVECKKRNKRMLLPTIHQVL